MDVATRYQPRARPDAYNNSRERNALPDDSGAESESLTRRKFQRTTPAEAEEHEFRKPVNPASATASASRVAADRRVSIGGRRKSLAQREGMRVPSGPREYPGSPGKRFPSTSNSNNAPSAPDTNRTFPPQPTPPTEPNEPLTRAQFGNPSSNEDTDSPTTPAERTNGNFDFIPAVNFDDFQSRLAGFDGPSSLLGEFPTPGGGRALPSEDAGGAGMVKGGAFGSGRPGTGKQQQHQSQPSEGERQGQSGVGRSASLRQRGASGTVAKGGTTQGNTTKDNSAPAHPNVSLRSRRQSNAPQQASGTGLSLPNTTTATTKHPRKSIGGNMFGGAVDRKSSAQAPPAVPPSDLPKAHLTRSSSLNKPKKTPLQPAASAGAEIPRISTLTATTASRQAKVKSLQPPPREPDPSTSTPPVRSPGKGGTNRAHTPSSSGNRRQSMAASGRASGLGARTISPTDARRLKRISMMQAPPMPTGIPPKAPPTPQPQEEPPPPARVPDHYPHLMENPPSLIPRKTSNSHSLTPNSARASPEGRFGFTGGGGPSLSSKSSYQSLLNATTTTNSRLPTPKTRSLHSSNANYGEEDASIPPVPAIPKSYESPKEHDTPFFSSSRKGSATTFTELPNSSQESSGAFAANPQPQTNRSSLELPPQTPRKTSHRRNETIGSPKEAGSSTVKPKQQQDATGRRNNTLQPLRLPPLNLLPLSSSFASSDPNFPKPTQELDRREERSTAQTPEPKRVPKTPSTPMTASKATFFRRQEDKQNKSRSSTSHNVLRDMMGFDETVTRFFDDSEPEPMPSGMPIPQPKQQPQQQSRSTITPFASGSMPKGSGEFARHMRGRPSGEYLDEGQNFSVGAYENVRAQPSKPQGPRPKTSGTASTYKSTPGTPGSGDSPVVEQTSQLPEQKKEGGGLRRKLSLGWRRTSSKAANHPDNKSSPHETPTEKDKGSKGNIKSSDMPPPKLPASATWSGELPTLANTTRPSLESARRKPVGTQAVVNGHAGSGSEHEQQTPAAPKTRALHSEQPQAAANNRTSSWGNFSFNSRNNANRPATNGVKAPRQPAQTSAPNALTKDKDDVAADEEMRRLSQKRRDVDSAARETEELKRRAVARSPMSPERVLHDRTCSLNIFERGEIVDYQKEGVYFTGNKNARKIIGSVTPSPTGDAKEKAGNYGYDDERGDYNIVMGDHLAYRYEVVDVLGKGSFGQVVRCVDHKDGGIVAVKIIRNKKRFHQQALVEVGILQRLRDWDPQGTHATLSITSSFYFRSHLCIVTPCLSINLYELIRAHNFTGFNLALIRRFARQLLTCLVLLQNKHIIHCDLKPENILLCEARKADVRVIDFGSSCREEEKVYTYIQSRFYRSPEVILGSSYGLGIDMWSFGCILAELFTGYPIFPGENEQEQLACIMEIFGPPDRHLVERCTRKKLFFDSVGKPRVTVSSKGRRRRPSSKTLQQALKTDDEALLDFITRCLRWDPDRRLKPHDAINHPFITNQPMHTRQGIPDEARRSARIRSQASGPGGGAGSPTKRSATHGSAFTHHQGQQSTGSNTPRATRVASAAVVPATEQTASTLRGGAGAHSSPSKLVPALGNVNANAAQRRQSSVASAQSAAGVKRASNGLLLSNGLGAGSAGSGGQFGTQAQLIAQQQAQQHHATLQVHHGQGPALSAQEKRAPSLAALAARESMAGASSAGGSGGGGRVGSGGSGGLAATGSGGGLGVQGYKDGSCTATPTTGGSSRWRL